MRTFKVSTNAGIFPYNNVVENSGVNSRHSDGFNMLLIDGSVRSLKASAAIAKSNIETYFRPTNNNSADLTKLYWDADKAL